MRSEVGAVLLLFRTRRIIDGMAAFKEGENSTDPRRCTPKSRQTGKRCKNAHLIDSAIDQLASALRSKNASVALAAARDILDRNGLKTVRREPVNQPLDLKKLSTDELIVLNAITRKARGQPVRELAAACVLTKELARSRSE
jgi:hypothetical protein